MSIYKRVKIILLLVSLVVLAFLFLGISSGSNRLSALMLDEKAFAALEEERQPADGELLAKLLFNGYELTLDQETDTYYYSIVEGNKRWNNPSVTFKSQSEDVVKVVFLQTDLTWEAVAASQNISILAYTDDAYCQYNLVCTTLPVLMLDVMQEGEGDPEVPIGPMNLPMQLRLFDNRKEANHIQRILSSEGEVRLRGASSRHYPQNGYRLSLTTDSLGGNERNNLLSLLGGRQDDDWILYAPYNDPEKIRNTISNNLWWGFGAESNSFDIQNGTQGKFAELFINGRYWGIYALMHPIDAKQLSLKDTGNPLTSDIYYRTISYQETTSEMFGHANQAVTGRFEIRDPHAETYDYRFWAPLDEWMNFLQSDDDVFGQHYPQRVELDNVIDMWIFNNVTMSVDNLGKNQNIIAKYRNGEYIMLFSPWDLDQTWGNIWTEGSPLFTVVRYPTNTILDPSDTGMTRAMSMNVANVNLRLQNRYKHLRSTLLSDESLTSMLADYEEDIFASGAYLRNKQRWPNAAYSENMQGIRDIIASRIAFLDHYVESLSEVTHE